MAAAAALVKPHFRTVLHPYEAALGPATSSSASAASWRHALAFSGQCCPRLWVSARHRRVQHAQPSSGPPPSPPPQGSKRAEAEKKVQQAAKMISEIVDEVTKEMFLTEAVAYLQADQADQNEATAIRVAVLKRVEFLDSDFLYALNGFIAATRDPGLAELLAAIRDEVLSQVSNRLPNAARALDAVLRYADKDARLGVLRTVVAGGAGDLPGVALDTLAATASQFIDEMEEVDVVLDRRLLARLCLVREELRLIRAESAFSDPSAEQEFVRANVPQRCAAFLKELVAVNDPLRRVGLLDRALQQDWDAAAPRGRVAAEDATQLKGQPDYVRPGRFLATLNSTARHLQEQAAAGGLPGTDGGAAVLARLETIRSEALVVLDRLQRGAGGGGTSAVGAAGVNASDGGGSSGEDEELLEGDEDGEGVEDQDGTVVEVEAPVEEQPQRGKEQEGGYSP